MSEKHSFRIVPTKRGRRFTLRDESPDTFPVVMYPEFDTPEQVTEYVKKEYPDAQIID